jgi:KUP system potassium uptake protein
MSVVTQDVSYVPAAERVSVEPVGEGIYRIVISYGFVQDPDVPAALELVDQPGLNLKAMNSTTFFLGRETLIASSRPGMAIWRERLFALMSRNAQRATAYFRIPPNRVVELGTQIEL